MEKLVENYTYKYFEQGFKLIRPPIILEVLLDYINLVNKSIDKGYDKTLELHTITASNGNKGKKPTDPARMDFDANKFNEWLESLGLLELWQKMSKKL